MIRASIALLGFCAVLSACSADQLYATGRNAQRVECMRQADTSVQERCLKDAGMSHDVYKKGADAVRP